MSEKNLKILTAVLGIVVFYQLFFSSSNSDRFTVNVQAQVAASDGLDLKAVGSLLKKAKDAKELEKLLNDPGEGINNLDLNGDGKVDYIYVKEYGNERAKGFSLTVSTGPGQVQEVATLEVEKTNDGANIQVKGNEQIYGQNHYYQDRWSGVGSFLLMSYLFRPHYPYHSPWGYGGYPPQYSTYRTVPTQSYRQRTNSASHSSTMTRGANNRSTSKIKSPNAGRNASNIRASLKRPTKSQRSFQSRTSTRVRSGGFGRSSSRSYSGRRGGSSFGK